eukprot:gene9797-13179_t
MLANSLIILTILLAILLVSHAQIPCDDIYGQHCPSYSGWEVGDCIKSVIDSGDAVPKDCLAYMEVHKQCRSDIEKHCVGKEFTSDLLPCLAEWTKPEDLEESCLESLPKKETKARVLSDKEKKKAAERRKIRNKAAKMAREF